MAFAEGAFRLAVVGDGGTSVESALRQVAKTTGKSHPLLDLPPMPAAAEHLWAWFQEINEGRTGTGYGSNQITWADIHAWSILTGTKPHPWEVRLLKSLDRVWRKTFNAPKPAVPEN